MPNIRLARDRAWLKKAKRDVPRRMRERRREKEKQAMAENELDPGEMDGRAIVEHLGRHVHRMDGGAQNAANVAVWAGIACARLLEYQKRLEDAGLLPANGETLP